MPEPKNITCVGPIMNRIARISKRIGRYGFVEALKRCDPLLDRLHRIDDGYEDRLFIGFAPPSTETNFHYIVHGQIYLDFFSTRAMGRLLQVKQLGTVPLNMNLFSSSQNRCGHSIETAVMSEAVLSRLGYDDGTINLAIASGLLHDAATPPLSEQGKCAEGIELDEERNIETVLKRQEIAELLEKYLLNPEDVAACVRGGHPVLRDLLNSKDGLDVDKIAYTGTDFSCSTGSPWYPHQFQDLLEASKAVPYVFDIYEDIELGDGIIFADKKRLAAFLKIRALMHRDVYYNPKNRAREAFIRRELKKLWERGILTKENMTEMYDETFLELLQRRMPEKLFRYLFQKEWPHCRELARFYTNDVAGVEEGFRNQPDVVIERHGTFNPAVKTRVKMGRKIKPFDRAMPEEAEELRRLAGQCEYVGVYGIYDD